MDALFCAMVEYLQYIGKSGRKTLLDAGVIQCVSDLDGNKVTIDVTLGQVYMTANVGDRYYSVGCEGDMWMGAHVGPDDYSSNLIEICNFEKFMLGFVPWYHAKLWPISTQQQVSKDVSKKSSLPFIGV